MTVPAMASRTMPDGTVVLAFDLSHLPSERRARVEAKAEDAYVREAAAAAIPDAYAAKLQRYRGFRAKGETARAVNRALGLPRTEGGFEVTATYVHKVIYRGR